MDDLEFLFVLLVAAAGLVRLADAIRVPYPIVLVLGGLAIGLVPGLPTVELDPDVVFLVFLPPLLVAAGFYASPQELLAERRPLGYLAIGLVLATMASVAVVAHAIVDGLPWGAAFALGAIVAPTDPVAALATFARVGVPQRVRLLVEGESMINDAIALVAFGVALDALAGGSFHAASAAVEVVVASVGGIAIGLGSGWLEVRVLRRLDDRALAIYATLVFAYGAYVVAEEAGVSGVLAAVMCGIYLGWHSHGAFDADTRLSSIAFWEVLEFTLNALIFILLGLQFQTITEDLSSDGMLFLQGLMISAVVIGVRIAMQFAPGAHTGDDWRERLVVGWSGMRGAISLAAALSVPLTATNRPELIVLTFTVILVTLVGQGLTLPLIVRALGVQSSRMWSPEEAIARLEAAQSALDRIDEIEDELEGDPPDALRRLRELYRTRFRMCQAVLMGESDAVPRVREARYRYSELRRDLIAVERGVLLGLRNEGRLRPDTLRMIERDLDLEEARLAAA